jgi:hypothetical protein
LEGYSYIYYALVFVPGGILLGVAVRRLNAWGVQEVLLVGIMIVLPGISLEIILVRVSGRPFSFGNVLLSLLLAIAGAMWINADRRGAKFQDLPGS